jgi:S-adenosylmethionine hydrolase
MKAVILSICPNARIVDISHEIEKFNMRMGAFMLASASPYFPEGTIHVAVVDPSVGTKRRALLIRTKKAFYIGPDNGVLTLAAYNQGIKHIYEITNRKLMLPRVSNTFHGRDIFSPAAAHLASETEPAEFGEEIHKIVTPSFTRITKRNDMLVGEILHIDGFGNMITNISEEDLKSIDIKRIATIRLKNTKLNLRLCKAYAEARKKEPLAIVGSHDFLEISICRGNAAKKFGTRSGDRITLFRP